MKWTRAVHHLSELAEKCAELATGPSYSLSVRQLWAFGNILGPADDLEWVNVVLVVDLPVEDVPWLSQPHGAEHWANAARLPKNPIVGLWRSAHAPVWNHHIVRPALVWDVESGVDEAVLTAVREGRGEDVRTSAPPADELRARLEDELALCLASLRRQTKEYDDRRWAPGKLTPVSDALWRASDGYLDVLDALG
ncbi:hypothetical protein [Lentzea sp. NBRC 105346]|uniref:DUF7711 family protein n=1 Tax=Lentzea sp. NBRC 105346 TaxID=3032205 RepID=UPI00255440F8|nr:hypothetical protein [Lentzea sp. NBRC 105346]